MSPCGDFEALRYRLYTVAAHVELRLSRTGRLQAARLYVLIDCGTSEAALVEHVMQLASAGADVIQLRDKQCADRLLFDRAVAAARALKTTTTLLIINDRADVAVAADADGVHVGQHELPAAAARRVVGSQRLVGVSTRRSSIFMLPSPRVLITSDVARPFHHKQNSLTSLLVSNT